MSNNVENWVTKKLQGFQLSCDAIDKSKIFKCDLKKNGEAYCYGGAESFDVDGRLEGGMILVDKIYYGGERSGHYWDEFEELLQNSKGYLSAIVVWEDGYIGYLKVDNGVVTDKKLIDCIEDDKG